MKPVLLFYLNTIIISIINKFHSLPKSVLQFCLTLNSQCYCISLVIEGGSGREGGEGAGRGSKTI